MICDKTNCTGCFACYNVCPKNAITMQEDEYGYIYPIINDEKCINCNLCKKICPSITKLEFHQPDVCYAVYSNDNKIRSKSTSGGVATVLSKNIITKGGIVYGASFIENCEVSHIRIDNEKDLHKLQGSKYVHSYIQDTYKNVKQDLIDNKEVLYIGTPCQIAGLKNFLGKEYEKLYLIDIICHGVPSQKYLKDEVNRINKSLDIDRVLFRDSNNYGLSIVKDSKITFTSSIKESPYADSFMEGLTLRPNCYDCKYAGKDRISDITIGDFWGLSKESKFYNDRHNGISTVIISTNKGMELFERCKSNFNFEQRDYSESVNGNTQLRTPAPKNKNYNKFQRLYLKKGFYYAYKKSTFIAKTKRKIKRILGVVRSGNGKIKN